MRLKFFLSICITLFVICIFHFTKIHAVKFYPVGANSFIFIVFFSSLFTKETIIQKFAKTIEGELNENTKKYTRNLTVIWCVFMFINLCLSIITVGMSEKIWAVYNGFISYIALGTLFVVEYIIRITLKKKNLL